MKLIAKLNTLSSAWNQPIHRLRRSNGNFCRTAAIVLAVSVGISNSGVTVQQRVAGEDTLPKRLYCYGKVIDKAGEPVDRAILTLIGSYSDADIMTGSPYKSAQPGTIAIQVMDGQFDIPIETSDQRFHGGDRKQPRMLVEAKGYATEVVSVPFHRMMIDLPFEIRLRKAEAERFRIVDPQGQPVANATVRVGLINDRRIPRLSDEPVTPRTAMTDESGFAMIPGFDRDNLVDVVVESSAYGIQRLPLEKSPDRWEAQLTPVGRVVGKIKITGIDDLNPWMEKPVLVYSVSDWRSGQLGPPRISWQQGVLDENGRFEVDRITYGWVNAYLPDPENPYYATGDPLVGWELNAESNPLEVTRTLDSSKKVVVEFVDANDDSPVAGIRFNNQSSDEFGRITFLVAASDSDSRQIWPEDPFQRIAYSSRGYDFDPRDKQEKAGPLTNQIRLTRAPPIVGSVVDESGQPIAGADITGNYSTSGMNNSMSTISDRHGRFMLRKISEGTAVTLKARKGKLTTNAKNQVQILAGESSEVTLLLSAQATAVLKGRVTDLAGNSVHGADLKFYRGSVFTEEDTEPAELNSGRSPHENQVIRTDQEGRYETPPITQFADRFQVKIEAIGYLPFESHFLNTANRAIDEQQILLDDFRLIPRPAMIPLDVETLNSENQAAVGNVELVFYGHRSGRRAVKSNEQGKLSIELPDVPQLVAASVDSYQVLFLPLDRISSPLKLHLKPKTKDYDLQPVPDFDRNPEAFENLAAELFKLVEAPLNSGDSYCRQSHFRDAQAIVDFDSFRKQVIESSQPIRYREDFLESNFEVIHQRDPDLAIKLVRESSLQPTWKALFFSQFASRTDDQELQQELFGEAVFELDRDTGIDRTTFTGSIALALMAAGHQDTAIEVVRRSWDSASGLQANLQAGDAKLNLGTRRNLIPMLVWLDEELAIEILDSLAGPDHEVGFVKTRMVVYQAMLDLDRAKALAQRWDLKWYEVIATLRDIIQNKCQSSGTSKELAARFAELLGDDQYAAEFYLYAASQTPVGDERTALMDRTIACLETATAGYTLSATWIPYLRDLRMGELDQLLFAMLKGPVDTFDQYHKQEELAAESCWLIWKDTALGVFLLEPVFDDSIWMTRDNWWRFSHNEIVQSTVAIDVEMCKRLIERWKKQFGNDDPLILMQLAHTMLKQIHEKYLDDRTSPPDLFRGDDD